MSYVRMIDVSVYAIDLVVRKSGIVVMNRWCS